jgi:hypothetical protein
MLRSVWPPGGPVINADTEKKRELAISCLVRRVLRSVDE